jgi:uncharacterized protein YndB with AHSA1/START domain
LKTIHHVFDTTAPRDTVFAALTTTQGLSGWGVALPDWLVSDYQRTGVFAVLGERTFAAGAEHARLLARAHPSGQWVEWLDPASS